MKFEKLVSLLLSEDAEEMFTNHKHIEFFEPHICTWSVGRKINGQFALWALMQHDSMVTIHRTVRTYFEGEEEVDFFDGHYLPRTDPWFKDNSFACPSVDVNENNKVSEFENGRIFADFKDALYIGLWGYNGIKNNMAVKKCLENLLNWYVSKEPQAKGLPVYVEDSDGELHEFDEYFGSGSKSVETQEQAKAREELRRVVAQIHITPPGPQKEALKKTARGLRQQLGDSEEEITKHIASDMTMAELNALTRTSESVE